MMTIHSDRELLQLAQLASRRPSARSLGRGRSLLAWVLRREFRRDVPPGSNITIRPARPVDRPQLERLAVLDERPLPGGDALVAEVDDEIVATVPLATGEPIVNPFRAHKDVVLLLEVRAAQLAV